MDFSVYEGNDELNKKQRAYGNHLAVSGLGIIFFGLWSVVKVFAEMAFGSLNLRDFLMEGLEDTAQMRSLMYGIFIVIIIVILLLHYYIGICAIKVGTGRKKKYLYLLLAVLLLVVNLSSFEKYLNYETNIDSQLDVTLASFLVDVANCVILINLVYTSIRYNQVRRRLGEG